jgi:capsular polysaccharide biosynthesis protein
LNNQNTAPDPEEQAIDLRVYLKILRKWRKLIVLVTVLSVITSGVISFFVLPPVYESKTLLMITQVTEKQQQATTGQGDLDSLVNSMSRIPVLTMNTYVGQLQSQALAQRVKDKLQLKGSLGKIKATATKDSNLVEVAVSNNNPQLAADIANTLSSEFLAMISERNQEQMERSVQFMMEQKGVTEKELEKANEELKNFDSQPRGVTFLQQELNAKSHDLNKYQSELTRAEVELQQLAAAKARLEEDLSVTPQVINVQKYDQSQGRVVASEEINPAHTSLIDKLNEKSAALAEKEAQVAGARRVLVTLNAEIDQLQAELTDKKATQDRLASEVKRLDETRKLLAEKATQTQIARSIDLGNTSVTVISPAMAQSKPVKPNKSMNMAIALMLGLLASVAWPCCWTP